MSSDHTRERHALAGKRIPVLLISVDQTTDSEGVTGQKPNINSLVPVRYATIVDAYFDGDIAHFFCRLKGHTNFSEAKFENDEVKRFFKQLVIDGTPEDEIYAAFGMPYSEAHDRGLNVASFQATVNILQDRSLKAATTVFTLFHGLKTRPVPTWRTHGFVGSKPKTITPLFDAASLSTPQITSYDVPDSTNLIFEVTTYQRDLPEGFSGLAIEVSFDPAHFDLIGRSTVSLLSPYDRFEFIFSARRQQADQWSAISFKLVGEDDEQSTDELLAIHWVIPIRIKANKRRIVISRTVNGLADAVIAAGVLSLGAARLPSTPLFEPQTWGIVGVWLGVIGLLGVAVKQIPYFRLS